MRFFVEIVTLFSARYAYDIPAIMIHFTKQTLSLVVAFVLAGVPAHTAVLPALASAAQAGALPRKPTFGAQLAPVPSDVRTQAGLQEGEGLLLPMVLPGQTAEAAGLRSGDILISIGGERVTGNATVLSFIRDNQSGATVKFEIWRNGKRESLTGKLVERARESSTDYDLDYSHVVSNGKRMRTVASKPKASGRFPAILLIQGLGPSVMDVPLTSPGAYSKILHAFATDGWVTFRVDKPGVGDSEGGPYEAVDFDTEMDIYRQSLKRLKELPYVDPDKIFIFGHSMGGAFGPIVASEFKLRGVAVAGTVCKTWTEYFLENTRRQEILAGRSLTAIDATLRNQAAAMSCLLDLKMKPDEVIAKFPHLAAAVREVAPSGLMYGRTVDFWAQLAGYNFPDFWTKVDAHVLALWGDSEFITTEEDHPLIAEIVNGARPGYGKYVKLNGSDHGFKKTSSMRDSFTRWSQPGGEFNPNVVEALKVWTKAVLGT